MVRPFHDHPLSRFSRFVKAHLHGHRGDRDTTALCGQHGVPARILRSVDNSATSLNSQS